MDERIESIESAFKLASSCRITCECGVEYWDAYNSGYDWEEGEREALEADANAVACQHSIGVICFNGCEYVDACTCWHERAIRYANWLDNNASAVAEYYRCEKQRLLEASKAVPVID